jgi:hypothetical protein
VAPDKQYSKSLVISWKSKRYRYFRRSNSVRVKVIANSKQYFLDHTLTPRLVPFVEKYQLVVGEVYTVYAISLTSQDINYLTMDKWDTNPFWHPADIFSIIDNRLPPDWYFHYRGFGKGQIVRGIWGYKELESEEYFQNLFEREEETLRIFRQRKKEIDTFHGIFYKDD